MPVTKQLRAAAGAVAVAVAALAPPPAGASAQGPVQPYRHNDPGGFRNILPPGECQTVDFTELGDFFGNGTIPAYCDDQRDMYEDLVYETPGLAADRVDDFFKDASFGVKPGDVTRSYSPRPDVTIVRDGFNVPHIYGETRAGVMFGAGYAGAEDRLFFMDVLRHAGRAQLSGFVGGNQKQMDADVWSNAPYTEEDLQRQIDLADEVYGEEGIQLRQDLDDYLTGINQYIAEAYADPRKMPGEYLAIGKPLLPWKGTDTIATAALIGGIFGKGGGGELGNAAVYQAARERFGADAGVEVWEDFRHANDPEAPTTVRGRSFPYQERTGIDPNAVAMPDPGSVTPAMRTGGTPSPEGLLGGLLGVAGVGSTPSAMSNALLVSGSESKSGHPLAVFGPQVGYFAPEILMEEELHGPGIDAAGATFPGISLYILLGRGRDYAWSATSAGQDIIDTFAERLCEPDGSEPTVESMHYMWRGECRPIEVLERVNVITPNAGDQSSPEVFRLESQRTVHGIVSARGTVDGHPVAFARLRSTYFHEGDSARGFAELNSSEEIEDVEDFQRAAAKIGFTFNWFYADERDIGYFNSGNNPVRADGVDPEFPAWGTGEYDWRDWCPVSPGSNCNGIQGGTNEARYTPFEEHPQAINQGYLSSWNNKQAPGYRAAEANYGFGPVYRSQSLDERIESRIAGAQKTDLPGLIDAMEDAGTVDLRGTQVLPWMLEAIRRGPGGVPADLAATVDGLEQWSGLGAHRRDRNRDGSYDAAASVQVMDAWWPHALEAVFRPALGDALFDAIHAQIPFDDHNRVGHLGSAFQDGWYGHLQKDLRGLVGEPVTGPYSRTYCGNGDLGACRTALLDSLRAAIATPQAELYPDPPGCLDGGTGSAQMCSEAVEFTTVGGVAIRDIHWINRPTWQQAIEIGGEQLPTGGGGGGGTGGIEGVYGGSPAPAGARKKCRGQKGRKRRACLCGQKKTKKARRKCRRKKLRRR